VTYHQKAKNMACFLKCFYNLPSASENPCCVWSRFGEIFTLVSVYSKSDCSRAVFTSEAEYKQ